MSRFYGGVKQSRNSNKGTGEVSLSAGTVIRKETRIQTIEFPWSLYCLVVVFLLLYLFYDSVPTEGTGEIGRFHSRGQHLCKFIGKKEAFT